MRRLSSFVSGRTVLPLLLCVLVGGGLFSPGCSSVTNDPPPVADSTFARILVELHLLEGRRQQDLGLPEAVDDTVLARYEVTPEDFERTLTHYSTHPSAFAALYNAVLDTLRAIEQDLPDPPSAESSR